jgi:hypothetical protein
MRSMRALVSVARRTRAQLLPRTGPVLLRVASSTSSTSSSSLPPADPATLALLTSYSKWRLLPATGRLSKTFEFRDAATAGRFVAQARDALARLSASECPLTHVEPAPQAQTPEAAAARAQGATAGAATGAGTKGKPAASGPRQISFVVDLRGVSEGKVTQRELDVALAVDDVAAELQLGGRWN